MQETQFKKEIETSFNIPCEIENDVNCAGLAEAKSVQVREPSVALARPLEPRYCGCLDYGMGKSSMDLKHLACEVGYMHMQDGAFRDLASWQPWLSM